MKKLKKILALLMSLTLALSAMGIVAFADDETGTSANPAELQVLDVSSGGSRPPANTVTFESDGYEDSYYYSWTATGNGTLTIVPSGEDWYFTVQIGKNFSESHSSIDADADDIALSGCTIDVVEDAPVIVSVRTNEYTAGIVVILATFEEASGSNELGTESNPDELVLDQEISVDVTGSENDYYYKWTAPSAGTLTIDVTSDDWFFDIGGSLFSMSEYSDGKLSADLEAGEVTIYVTSDSWSSATVTFTASFSAEGDNEGDPTGSVNNPDTTLTIPNDYSPTTLGGNAGYTYKYFEGFGGDYTITMSGDSWQYDIRNSAGTSIIGGIQKSNDTSPVSSKTVTFSPPATYYIWVDTLDGSVGTVEFSIVEADVESDFIYDAANVITVGNNSLNSLDSEKTTIYGFTVGEAGKYEFKSTDANVVVSYWGSYAGGSFAGVTPEGETNSYELECPNAGPTYYIGVSGAENVTLTVTKTGDVEISDADKPWTYYENKVEPEEFTLTLGTNDEIVYIDVTDDNADTIVLGTDGYYHLGTADGPIVYVDLGSKAPYGISLPEMYSVGQIRVYLYDTEGNLVDKVDYNNAYAEFAAANGVDLSSDDDLSKIYYPLTDDLKEIYQVVGSIKGWYDKDSIEGTYLFGNADVDEDTAWMFACFYVDVEETTDNGSASTDNGSASTDNGSTSTDNATAELVEKIEAAKDGETVTVKISATETPVIPEEVLEAAKGKDVNIVIELGDYTWTVNGKDITDIKEVNLEVKFDTNAVKEEVINTVAKEGEEVVQLSLSYDGVFGFNAKLTFNVGAENKDKYGNLYYYNNGKLEFVSSNIIDENGDVSIDFQHASDYVVVIGDEYVPLATGDAANMFGYVIALAGCAIVLAGALVARKKLA